MGTTGLSVRNDTVRLLEPSFSFRSSQVLVYSSIVVQEPLFYSVSFSPVCPSTAEGKCRHRRFTDLPGHRIMKTSVLRLREVAVHEFRPLDQRQSGTFVFEQTTGAVRRTLFCCN